MAQRHARTALALAIALAGLQATAMAENLSPNLRINGFLTAGATTITEDFEGLYLDDSYGIKGFNEDGTSEWDNVLGLQVGYQVNDRVEVVGQLVSTGQKGYSTEAEWAYMAYSHNDNLRVRAGRFAAPFYMYSESLRVGQAYPWARLPVELYFGIPTKSLEGIDLLYRMPVGDWNFDSQVYFGSSSAAFGRIEKMGGLNLNISSSSLTLHAGYGTGNLDFSFSGNFGGTNVEQFEGLLNAFGGSLDAANVPVTFADIGAIYDDGSWFAAAEYGQLRIQDYANNFDAGYVSVGHYFGRWLPFVTYAKQNALETEACNARFSPTLTSAAAQAGNAAAGAAGLALMAAGATANAAAAASAANEAGVEYAGNPSSQNLAILNTAVAAATTAELAAIQASLLADQIGGLAAEAAAGAGMLAGGVDSLCRGTEQASYTLGARFDATKNVSIKGEISHVRDFNNTTGMLTGVSLQQVQNDSTQIITLNINVAF